MSFCNNCFLIKFKCSNVSTGVSIRISKTLLNSCNRPSIRHTFFCFPNFTTKRRSSFFIRFGDYIKINFCNVSSMSSSESLGSAFCWDSFGIWFFLPFCFYIIIFLFVKSNIPPSIWFHTSIRPVTVTILFWTTYFCCCLNCSGFFFRFIYWLCFIINCTHFYFFMDTNITIFFIISDKNIYSFTSIIINY